MRLRQKRGHIGRQGSPGTLSAESKSGQPVAQDGLCLAEA